MSSEGLRDVPPLDTQRHMVLAFKEMLHSIRKHAAAKQVRIGITCSGRELTLDVCDDGIGFDSAAAHEGHGLTSLRQLARELGGELRITTAPGQGTHLVLTSKVSPPCHSLSGSSKTMPPFATHTAKSKKLLTDGNFLRAIAELMGTEGDFSPDCDNVDDIRKAKPLSSLSNADVLESLKQLKADY